MSQGGGAESGRGSVKAAPLLDSWGLRPTL